jgi:glycyl-tRNA synthetase
LSEERREDRDLYERVMEVSRRRGFLLPSCRIYGGARGFYDYGPLGALLKRKIEEKWREYYVYREGFMEIEAPTLLIGEVFEASGHVDHFIDPMTYCRECGEFFRADHLVEEELGIDAEGLSIEELERLIREHDLRCPECGGELGEVTEFNLMFRTNIGPKEGRDGYLRPETAQAIFIQFKDLYRWARQRLPFGVVQIGRAYRNEISPRQGVIRLREFTQAEAEVFLDPEDKRYPGRWDYERERLLFYPIEEQRKDDGKMLEMCVEEAVEEGLVSQPIGYFLGLTKRMLVEMGIDEGAIRARQHLPEERAHYARDCWDVEVRLDRFGWVEVVGIADRTDYDLRRHSEHSGEDLRAFEELDEPRIVYRPEPIMEKLGPEFKSDAPKIAEELRRIKAESREELEGGLTVEVDGEEIEVPPDCYEIVEEKVTGRRFYPHVVEPSYGIDRILYCVLEHNFDPEEGMFRFPAWLAPIEVGVFPLLKRDDMVRYARRIARELREEGFTVEYDDSGSIGRRYARADEIGVPYCVTVDHDTLEEDTVTIRDRDTTEQVRVPVDELPEILRGLIDGEIEFEEAGEPV